MTILFTNISQLVNVREESTLLRGKELSELPVIDKAFLMVEDDTIMTYGSMADLDWKVPVQPETVVNLKGQIVLPCWCDSHTHIVFSGSRENEFVDKIKGLSYAEIAARGGGILNSARKLNETSEEELYRQSYKRLQEVQRLGTGALEIKSGYGLTLEGELKMLRVIRRLKQDSGMLIKSTFLGAHTLPAEYKENPEAYIDILLNQMLPAVAGEKLADYIDVFCETGFFTPEQTDRICKAGIAVGLKPRLHVNQLTSIGGIETAIANEAVSVDHLETMTENDIALLGKWKGIATLLPTAAFFLRMPMQPARSIIDAGAAVALASDYNPGSSPSGNMNFVNSISCIQMKMLPEEVINASTINGAFALEAASQVGSITEGKKANLIITKPIPSYTFMPYSFGSQLIDRVMLNGVFVEDAAHAGTR
ncbi:MAG TPA: imidazolonepropionase [Ferruginibacter sp.]|nr:imidazolonepropionase [Ferruginibacter sp.]HRO17500.1 imidazolonepropionase [Ferruginibacter sp.]HRQ20247.1 imidazolonepropionase [Ferruginibacter sp.]